MTVVAVIASLIPVFQNASYWDYSETSAGTVSPVTVFVSSFSVTPIPD
jgi:hypothetical protein